MEFGGHCGEGHLLGCHRPTLRKGRASKARLQEMTVEAGSVPKEVGGALCM